MFNVNDYVIYNHFVCKIIGFDNFNGRDYYVLNSLSDSSLKINVPIDNNCDVYKLLCDKVDEVKCIFVDEAQFLSVEHVDQLFKITKLLDVPVICYGLRTNFKSELFLGSMRLLALSDELNEFKSLCNCGNMARFNARRLNGEFLYDGDDILIDGSSEVEYVPLCGECYLEKVLKNN